MKVVSLTAENVKRIRAVEIHPDPDGNVVVIAGRNAQGKTSILDSIWLALGGAPAGKASSRPVRDGQKTATVTLDLGEIRVTRTWTADGKSKLTVNAADGARYSSPQALLDSLVGRLSFDPLAFAQQDERAQRKALLELVDLPFDPDELAEHRRGVFDERTDVNRDLKQAAAQLAGLPIPPGDLPEQEVSSADLLGQARQAQQSQAAAERAQQDLTAAADRISRAKAELEAAMRAKREAAQRIAELPADIPDPLSFEEKLASIDQVNAAVRSALQRKTVAARVEELKALAEQHTAQISSLDEQRDSALAAAAMPIDGLSFDDTGVSYQGVPLKQASAAEQLRVSIAMAMALNPRIRVLRITDGSLLDSTNMALIEQMAADSEFQVWIERVDESGQVGVLIEDGQVVTALTAAAGVA